MESDIKRCMNALEKLREQTPKTAEDIGQGHLNDIHRVLKQESERLLGMLYKLPEIKPSYH